MENSISDFYIGIVINEIWGRMMKYQGLEKFLWVSDLLRDSFPWSLVLLITNVYNPNSNLKAIWLATQ